MNYQEYKTKYINLINEMFKYSVDQVGSEYFANKLGELVDSNPSEWEEMVDEEIEAGLAA